MDGRCFRHSFEIAEDICRNCGWDFCSECLVYAHGPSEPPLCLNCALAKAGVRSNAATPPARSKREIKKRQKEMARQKKKEGAGLNKVEVRAELDLGVPEGSSSAFDWANDDGSDQVVSF